MPALRAGNRHCENSGKAEDSWAPKGAFLLQIRESEVHKSHRQTVPPPLTLRITPAIACAQGARRASTSPKAKGVWRAQTQCPPRPQHCFARPILSFQSSQQQPSDLRSHDPAVNAAVQHGSPNSSVNKSFSSSQRPYASSTSHFPSADHSPNRSLMLSDVPSPTPYPVPDLPHGSGGQPSTAFTDLSTLAFAPYRPYAASHPPPPPPGHSQPHTPGPPCHSAPGHPPSSPSAQHLGPSATVPTLDRVTLGTWASPTMRQPSPKPHGPAASQPAPLPALPAQPGRASPPREPRAPHDALQRVAGHGPRSEHLPRPQVNVLPEAGVGYPPSARDTTGMSLCPSAAPTKRIQCPPRG